MIRGYVALISAWVNRRPIANWIVDGYGRWRRIPFTSFWVAIRKEY